MKVRIEGHEDHDEGEQVGVTEIKPVRFVKEMPCAVKKREMETEDPAAECHSNSDLKVLFDLRIQEEKNTEE